MIEEITGRAKGGVARAASLTGEERRQIARKAAAARWSKDMLFATHEGPVKIGDVVIPAANLSDGTRVLSQGQFLQAIGRSRSPKAGTGAYAAVDELPFFLQATTLKPFISNELLESTKPIFYRTKSGSHAVGYDALLLPRVCNVYLDYRNDQLAKHGRVPLRYAHIIAACDRLTRGLQELGIIGLVDEATGFQEVRDRLALQEILDKYLRHDLATWAKRFPDDFYKQIFRLRKWQWKGMKVNRPQVVAHYTLDFVWSRLAPGILEEMERRMPRNESGRKKGGFPQLLTDDIGIPELRSHLDVVVALMMTAPNWDTFIRAINIARPKKGTNLELPFVDENVH
jgi:P63C domain